MPTRFIMVITTRAYDRPAFYHIMDNVLWMRYNIEKELLDDGIQDISHLSTLKDDVIGGLQYENKNSIEAFDYSSITQESFDQFRISSKLESEPLHRLFALMYTPPLYDTSRASMVCPSSKTNPALNVLQRQESGALDIFNVKPRVNDGSVASVFIGTETQHIFHCSLSHTTDHRDSNVRAVGRRKLNPFCTLVTVM
jgi:hypothetical protein